MYKSLCFETPRAPSCNNVPLLRFLVTSDAGQHLPIALLCGSHNGARRRETPVGGGAEVAFLRCRCCRHGNFRRSELYGRSGLGIGTNTERLGLGLSLLLQLGGLLQRLGADGPTLLQGLGAAGLQFVLSLLRALAIQLDLLSELVATLLLGLLRELQGRRGLALCGCLGLPLRHGLQAFLFRHLRLGNSNHCLRLLSQTLGGFLELSLAGLCLGGPVTLLVALPEEIVDEPAQHILSFRRRLFLDIAVVVELASRRFLVDLRCGPLGLLGLLLCLVLVLVVLRVRGGRLVRGDELVELDDQPLVVHVPKRLHLLVADQGQQGGGTLRGRGRGGAPQRACRGRRLRVASVVSAPRAALQVPRKGEGRGYGKLPARLRRGRPSSPRRFRSQRSSGGTAGPSQRRRARIRKASGAAASRQTVPAR
mmetsp:Transcript_97163/g.313251  ORF Transcript_97163/g.313251 Transcript_97163/m.313251 type:complete len:423 (-) Transcript_97163:296-1564(-)